jgi:hypothetical protein
MRAIANIKQKIFCGLQNSFFPELPEPKRPAVDRIFGRRTTVSTSLFFLENIHILAQLA